MFSCSKEYLRREVRGNYKFSDFMGKYIWKKTTIRWLKTDKEGWKKKGQKEIIYKRSFKIQNIISFISKQKKYNESL
jgi:hypothetical protein